MTKLEEYEIGCYIITQFCIKNKIRKPFINIDNTLSVLGHYNFNKMSTITINLLLCNKITKKNNPMMIKESTIIGTLLHEFGHYLHFKYNIELTKKFKKIKNEPFIHYHEISIEEDIAECIRLFILNPNRLLKGRPKRYKILSQIFKYLWYTKNINSFIDNKYKENNEALDILKWINFEV